MNSFDPENIDELIIIFVAGTSTPEKDTLLYPTNLYFMKPKL